VRYLSWPEVELTVADALQLGRFLERLQWVERRWFVRSHNTVVEGPTSPEIILEALGRTPLTRQQFARVTGLDLHVCSVNLSRLKGRGLVVGEADGTWRLVEG
jgi:hypothetical protein